MNNNGYISISIIIPHKNSPNKLVRLLDSIPDNKIIEIIVVDDKSDITLSALNLSDDYPYVKFLNNPGPLYDPGSARNYGLNHCAGEWVFFADADDFFVENGVSELIKSLLQINDMVDIVFFKPTSIIERDFSKGVRHTRYSDAIDDFLLNNNDNSLRYMWSGPVSKLIRKDLLDRKKILFDPQLGCEDVIFSVRSGHYARKITCVNTIVYCITESSESLTARLNSELALKCLSATIRKDEQLLLWNVRIQLNWGVTYFLMSQPHKHFVRKSSIYYRYCLFLLKRMFYQALKSSKNR